MSILSICVCGCLPRASSRLHKFGHSSECQCCPRRARGKKQENDFLLSVCVGRNPAAPEPHVPAPRGPTGVKTSTELSASTSSSLVRDLAPGDEYLFPDAGAAES